MRSTGSRGLPVADAIAMNRDLAASLPPGALIYKKIDSMLRGHPCAELAAVLDGRDEIRALIAPALPGRAADDRGRLPANRRVAHRRPGGDLRLRPDLPVRRIDLWTVQQGGGAVADAIDAAGAGLLVADAVTDADLSAIALGVVASGIQVVAGAAGLARQLAVVMCPAGQGAGLGAGRRRGAGGGGQPEPGDRCPGRDAGERRRAGDSPPAGRAAWRRPGSRARGR